MDRSATIYYPYQLWLLEYESRHPENKGRIRYMILKNDVFRTQKDPWNFNKYYLSGGHRVEQSLKHVKENTGLILDVGCGNGYSSHLLEKSGNVVINTDISSTAISIAKSKFKNINGVTADMYNLPFKKETFDLITLIGVLDYSLRAGNADELLIKLKSIMKRDGCIIIMLSIKKEDKNLSKTEFIELILFTIPRSSAAAGTSHSQCNLRRLIRAMPHSSAVGRFTSSNFKIINSYPATNRCTFFIDRIRFIPNYFKRIIDASISVIIPDSFAWHYVIYAQNDYSTPRS